MAYSAQKKKMMQLVHIGKKQLALDDGTYRAVLEQVTGKASSKDCSALELRKVVEHMESHGFKVTPAKKHKTYKPDAATAKQPLIDKIEALLADSKLPWSYADAIAKQMYGIDKLTFCSARQLSGVVTALTKRAQKQAKSNMESNQA